MHRHIFFLLLLIASKSPAQSIIYSTANAHSHNDYEQPHPFYAAWNQSFGSIEADIFLEKGELLVAHNREELTRHRSLDSLYLQPLQRCLLNNHGYVYTDSNRRLQLMIDIKTDAIATLNRLVEKLQGYPVLLNSPSLKIVISGSRPAPSAFSSWPPWILFDGDLQKDYTEEELQKIEMISDNFHRYSSWQGEGELPGKDRKLILDLIGKVHKLHKKIRFWNAPDSPTAWKTFMELEVDYINTDHIEQLAAFLH